jgi:hypothetical protein
MESRLGVEWMLSYQISDFHFWHDFWVFLKQSRSGVPPILALIEVPSHLIFGSTALVTQHLYHIAFVLAFMVPWIGFSRSRTQYWLSFATCVVFLASTSKIATVGGNQQGYDVYFPLMLMLAIGFTVRAGQAASSRSAIAFAVAAGLSAAIMELLRPFGLFLLLVLGLYAALLLYRQRKPALLGMLVPILLISGVWHAKLVVFNGGQIIWSNNGGHNLYNSWGPLISEKPDPGPFSPAEKEAMMHQEFVNSKHPELRHDSEYHTELSRVRAREVKRWIVSHPAESLRHVSVGLKRLFQPKIIVFTMIWGDNKEDKIKLKSELVPKGPEIDVYPYFVWTTTAWFALNLLLLPVAVVSRRTLAVFRLPESAFLVSGIMITAVTVIGERGEEARFLFTLLPLLAAYPSIIAFAPARTAGDLPRLTWRTESVARKGEPTTVTRSTSARAAQRPVKFGSRRSTKDRTPSAASSVLLKRR